MNEPLKNPCLECDHHLLGGSKNACECTNCEERIAYVNAIGTCPGESVNEGVSLEGHAGTDSEKILKTLNDMKQTQKDSLVEDHIFDEMLDDATEDIQPQKDQFIEDSQTEKSIDNQIEDHIKAMCKDAGMTIEQIRANAKNIYDKQALQLFHETRDRIIKSLNSGYFGKLSQTQIGKFLDVSNHAISVRMQNIGISPMNPRKEIKKALKRKKSKTPSTAKPKKDKKTPDPAQLTLRLDFADFPEIYDDLLALAIQEIRTIENQALYIFKQIHKRGLNIKEL